MNIVELNTQQLIGSIKQSMEYMEYKRCEAKLEQNPELMKRVEEFCAHNFRLQNDAEEAQIFKVMDQLSHESEELHKIPEVHAYLQSELALCRLLQRISLEIVGGVDIRIPHQ